MYIHSPDQYKVERSQASELSNNFLFSTVTVPYLIYSQKTLTSNYEELVSLLASSQPPSHVRRVNTWHQTHIPQGTILFKKPLIVESLSHFCVHVYNNLSG